MSNAQLTTRDARQKSVLDLIRSPAMLDQLRAALPKHVTPERLVRIVLTEIRRVPKLAECKQQSLLGAIVQAAQLGLEPGVLGQCWIIPFGGEAVFIPGYRGLVQLMWRSNLVRAVSARAVFTGDTFGYDFGEDRIAHTPGGETDPEKLTHAWAAIHTTAGGRIFDVMTREEIERTRRRSRAGTSGPWVTDYAEMAKKTVLRRLAKLAPASVELMTALRLDDEADTGAPQEFDLSPDMAVPAEATSEAGEEGGGE